MEKVTAEMYQQDPERYTLVEGTTEGAPTCTYGNTQEWVGYDKVEGTFIRFTKSVFKKLISELKTNDGAHGMNAAGDSVKTENYKVNIMENEISITGTATPGEVIYFAGGCFWGTEHFFKLISGVTATEVGFANGVTQDPAYKDVIKGDTGFAETVKVTYDPQRIELRQLLDLFFKTIDPTSVNRQGNDVGSQYRSGIFYTAPHQLPVIAETLKELAAQYEKPLAIEAEPLKNFFTAEDYHQNYLEENPGGYCHIGSDLFELARNANR